MDRKAIFVAVTLLALLVLRPAVETVAQGSALTGGTVSYSGHLSNDAGQPVSDGTYAFSFALYDAPTDGTVLWSETQSGVTVKGGVFTARLGRMTPFTREATTSNGWLAASVRGPGETGFTALAPRQPWSAAVPAAASNLATGPSCPHDHFGELWMANSNGTPGNAGLHIVDTAANGAGIVGVANNGALAWGVDGQSAEGVGVRGASTNGFAMDAIGNAEQSRDSGGWVKAMARVAGTNITRCYNSQASGASVSTPPCGFSSTGWFANYTVDFGFEVNDRFISITPEWDDVADAFGWVKSFPTANQVYVRLKQDSAFYIIVY